MKTSVIFGLRTAERASLQDEWDGDNLRHPPKFIAAHERTFQRLGSAKTHREKVGDRIQVGSYTYSLSHGAPKGFREYAQPRVIYAESAELLHRIDEAIKKLHEKRRDVMEAAWMRGRALRKADCIGGE